MSKKSNKLRRKLFRSLKRWLKNPFSYLLILILALIVLSTYVVYKTETKTDSGITGLFDAVWHTIVAVVAAYYDFYVKSVPGRFASLVLLLFGMALWAVIIGKITSVIMDIQSKNNRGLKKIRPMKGHFLLCGWKNGFEELLATVLRSNPDITPDMIVLVNNAPSQLVEQLKENIEFKSVKYVAGDFSDADTLKRAHIETASRILVLADSGNGKSSNMEVDSRTVLAVLTMKNMNPSVYISAELLDEKLAEHLRLAHCDEIILTQEYEHSLLATASSGQGYSNVIKSLISDDSDTGIIVTDFPASYVGKSYQELEDFYSKKGESEILVGLLLNSGNYQQMKKDSLEGSCNEPLLTPKGSYIIPKYAKSILVCSNCIS
ncbi:MAG: NAD-binding protein [Treponema sp.]|uniref:TrkA-related ion transporter n=1 Tax=Treponema sp. TaxID=166 RepID=UPI0025DB947B|nr:NAD-binding protein [Treponema sp.]MBQ8679283.1 NAD-binding protein [Treponema sp.]